MMRRAITVLLFITISSLLFASDAAPKPRDYSSQHITGYVDPNISLVANNIVYYENGKYGINLDINDSSNSVSNLISPTAIPLSVPGLQVGQFSVVSSVTNYKVVITHTPMILQPDEGEPAGNAPRFDYELGVIYTTDGINYTSLLCLSSPNNQLPLSTTVIEIPLMIAQEGVVMIQDAGIYFRLTEGAPIPEPGNYKSNVTFNVEPTS